MDDSTLAGRPKFYSVLGRLNLMHNRRAAVARHPPVPVLYPAVEVTAAAMLLHEGVEGS